MDHDKIAEALKAKAKAKLAAAGYAGRPELNAAMDAMIDAMTEGPDEMPAPADSDDAPSAAPKLEGEGDTVTRQG